jgi:hypothetical protein
MTQSKKVQLNWLSLIKSQEIKKRKLKEAQLCMAGLCKTK